MAEQHSCAFRTSIGGQALIEGILMRGPEKEAIVVRDQEGRLVEKTEELKLVKDRFPILGLPLVRGTVNFLDSMIHGVKALMYSADFYPDDEAAQPSKFEQWLEKHLSSKKLESARGGPGGGAGGWGERFFVHGASHTAHRRGFTFFPGLSHVGAELDGGPFEDLHLYAVSDRLLPSKGYLPGVPVPRSRAQDHLLL